MMSPEQAKVVSDVYKRLWDSDNNRKDWDELDDQLSYLEWLNDNEMVTEATFLLVKHLTGTVNCTSPACTKVNCFAKLVVESADNIITLYKETNYLPIKNRYVLAHYVALTYLELIVFVEIK